MTSSPPKNPVVVTRVIAVAVAVRVTDDGNLNQEPEASGGTTGVVVVTRLAKTAENGGMRVVGRSDDVARRRGTVTRETLTPGTGLVMSARAADPCIKVHIKLTIKVSVQVLYF